MDKNMKWGLRVEKATFEWELASVNEDGKDELSQSNSLAPFRVENIDMYVQRGSLVAIVGRVGSGKSSLLMGLIGEMRRVSGTVSFGGRVAYCPQTAWIQNASVVSIEFTIYLLFLPHNLKRDNILFGQPYDEEKYWHVIEQASLVHDLELLADGDLTEVGILSPFFVP